MSQYSVSTTAGSLPGSVVEQVTTNSGVAVPVAHNLNLLGISSSANNDNGIATSASGSTANVILTNRTSGTVITADATPTAIITFPLGATPGVYIFEGNLIGFDTTDTAGGAYTFVSGFRTTGAAAVEISTEFKDVFEEAAMAAADFSIAASGNNFVLTVQGINAKTIDWNAYLTYRMVT